MGLESEVWHVSRQQVFLMPGTAGKLVAGRAAGTDHTMVWPPGGTPTAAGLSSRLSKAKAVFRGRHPSARKD